MVLENLSLLLSRAKLRLRNRRRGAPPTRWPTRAESASSSVVRSHTAFARCGLLWVRRIGFTRLLEREGSTWHRGATAGLPFRLGVRSSLDTPLGESGSQRKAQNALCRRAYFRPLSPAARPTTGPSLTGKAGRRQDTHTGAENQVAARIPVGRGNGRAIRSGAVRFKAARPCLPQTPSEIPTA